MIEKLPPLTPPYTGGEEVSLRLREITKRSLPPCKGRAVKFFTFCHPELAKDLLPQREILAGDASLPLGMTEGLFIMTKWFPEVTKATKGQKMENLTALLTQGELEGVVQSKISKSKIEKLLRHFVPSESETVSNRLPLQESFQLSIFNFQLFHRGFL